MTQISSVSWTDAERDYLQKHHVVRVVLDPDWYPFEFRDKHGSRGLSRAYLDHISAVTGLTFEYVSAQNTSEAEAAFANGQAMVSTGVPVDQGADFGIHTRPFLTAEAVIIVRADAPLILSTRALQGKRVAIVKDTGTIPAIRAAYPALQLVVFGTSRDAMRAVANRQVDAAIELAPSAAVLLRTHFPGILQITATTAVESKLYFVVQPNDPMLAEILDRVIGSMTNAEHETLQQRWLTIIPPPRLTWQDLLRQSAPYLACILALVVFSALWNIRLAKAKRMAVSANSAKSRFLAIMSHEIRTPIYAVLGNLQLLSRSALDSIQHRFVDTSYLAATILLQQIDDLLDLSRIELGTFAITPQPCQPLLIAEQTLLMVERQAHEKGLYLQMQLTDSLPSSVRADPVRLKQILLNLLNNAVKFTDSGHVLMRLSCVATLSNDVRLCFVIEDSGPGIPEEAQTHLFEPFYQVDDPITRRRGGVGLGLAIAHRLVTLMGGRISVSSAIGHGTHMTVELPVEVIEDSPLQDMQDLRIGIAMADTAVRHTIHQCLAQRGATVCDANQVERETRHDFDLIIVDDGTNASLTSIPYIELTIDELANAKAGTLSINPLLPSRLLEACETALGIAPTTSAAVPSAQMKAGRVLVAEDHPVSRALLRDQLLALGYSCDVVEDGRAALAALASDHYALLLTDYHMPELSGLALIRDIRAREQAHSGAHLPIIVLSADALDTTIADAADAGADGYLRKPVTLEALANTLNQCLPDAALHPASLPSSADLAQLLAKFQQTTKADMAQLRIAFNERNREQLFAIAHRISGAAQYIKHGAIALAASELERHAKQAESLDELTDKIAQLEAAVAHWDGTSNQTNQTRQ